MTGRRRAPERAPARKPALLVAAAVLVATPAVVYAGLQLGEAASNAARQPTSPSASPPSSSTTGRTSRLPALIFPVPAPDEPQPWSPDDGPLPPHAVPSTPPAPDVEDRPAPTASRSSRPPAPPAPSRPADLQGVGPGDGAATPAPPREPVAPEPAPEPHPTAALGLPELVNRERLAAGCGPIAIDPALQEHAEQHAVVQAEQDRMHHSAGPAGADTWAENVAAGQRTALEVHDDWMASSGHRANVLDCDFTVIGVAAADSPTGVRYWTQVFATQNPAEERHS